MGEPVSIILRMVKEVGSPKLLFENLDLTPIYPIHLESPDWYAAVDFAPEKVVDSRRRLFKKASAEKALVLAFHFPLLGLGYIVHKKKAWLWQPI